MTTNAGSRDAVILDAIDGLHDELVSVALDIHARPELNYEEHFACGLLSDFLERTGFVVERGVGGVETAFRAVGRGGGGDGPTVAILAEYDALPEIGHGCGHNLLAISAIGAGIGARAIMDSLPGTLVVLGTPAEEGGGGKVRMLEAGVFDGVDIALSSHPAPGSTQTVVPLDVPFDATWGLAMVGYRYEYFGRAAHAAAGPERGINALNAVIHLFTGIDALRQHLREDVRMHGVITDGGRAANVVPDFAAANFMLRSRSRDYLAEVVEKVRGVAEGAALMTGARLEVKSAYPLYEETRLNNVLAQASAKHARAVGMDVRNEELGALRGGASTDFGNVSQVVPSFALRFPVSASPIAGHSTQMTEAAKSELGLTSALLTAKTLALTAAELLSDRSLVTAAQDEFTSRGG